MNNILCEHENILTKQLIDNDFLHDSMSTSKVLLFPAMKNSTSVGVPLQDLYFAKVSIVFSLERSLCHFSSEYTQTTILSSFPTLHQNHEILTTIRWTMQTIRIFFALLFKSRI